MGSLRWLVCGLGAERELVSDCWKNSSGKCCGDRFLADRLGEYRTHSSLQRGLKVKDNWGVLAGDWGSGNRAAMERKVEGLGGDGG